MRNQGVRRRRRSKSPVTKIFTLLTVCAVVIGVVLALEETGMLGDWIGQFVGEGKYQKSTNNAAIPELATDNSQDASQTKKTVRNTPDTPVKRRKSPPPSQNSSHGPSREKKIYQKLLQRFSQGDFVACLKECRRGEKREISSQLLANLQQLEAKCLAGLQLGDGVTQKPKLTGEVTKISMANGKQYVGQVVSQSPNIVRLKVVWDKKSKMTVPLPTKRIARQESISAREYQAELLADIEKRVTNIDLRDSRKVLKLAEECKREKAPQLLAALVERLYANGQAMEDVIEYKARLIYRYHLWHDAVGEKKIADKKLKQLMKKFSNTEIARQAKEDREQIEQQARQLAKVTPRKELQPDPPQNTPRPKKSAQNSQLATALSSGDQYYNSGFAHLRKSFPGKPRADEELQLAKEDFGKARKHYEKALEYAPGDPTIQSKLQQTMEYYHHCIKQSRVMR